MNRSIILLMVVAIVFIGCSTKKSSVGSGGTVVVVVDPLDRPTIRKQIELSFTQKIKTPQPEPLFNLVWTDADLLENHTRSPLILLASTLDGDGPTAKLLRRMLSSEVLAGVESGEFSIFVHSDAWASDQQLYILVGRNRRELAERAVEWCDSIAKWAIKYERLRLQDDLYSRNEQKSLERELHDKYGFYIRIQHDYVIAQENDSLNFIRFIRYHPERWFMIAWGDMADSSELTPQFVYNKRKEFGNMFLDPVMHYDDHWDSNEDLLNGQNAILVRGVWATVGPTGGGPFFSYGIWVSAEKRYYIVGGSVFVPDQSKMNYLWQLDAIVQTFLPPREIERQNG